MEMMEYFDIEYTKKELKRYLEKGTEPELCIKIKSNDYMIIPLSDKISFQKIGVTTETYYNSVEELFSSELVDGIILNRDWELVDDIWFY